MPNDKAATLSRDNIADAIDAKVGILLAQDEINTSAKIEKAGATAKKPHRKLGSAGHAKG